MFASADQAYCMCQLQDVANKQGQVLMRRVSPPSGHTIGKIEYTTKSTKDVGKTQVEGYYVTDCNFDFNEGGDPSPFSDKPVPFLPDQLRKLCGEAGWGYYVMIRLRMKHTLSSGPRKAGSEYC